MINGFLTVSSLEGGKIQLDLEIFQLNSLIDEAIEEAVVVNKEVDIVFKRSENFTVEADRDKIGQVLNNFLNNAVKYSPNQKVITISLEKINEWRKLW